MFCLSEAQVHVVGGGLAGSEAAYLLAQKGHRVVLHEMRPLKMTPAHRTSGFAELVCSNSLKSQMPASASGMLKAEMRLLGSLVLDTAEKTRVPAGEALAVDRELFSAEISRILESHPRIQVLREEVLSVFPEAITVLATGPLTSAGLSAWLAQVTGVSDLYFYDAIAPVVETDSIDFTHTFCANRNARTWENEEPSYLNCPMDQATYEHFVQALVEAEKVAPLSFEKEIFYQGCQPIEALALSGMHTLRFGPMKPVGLVDAEGKMPYAVLQLRSENLSGTAYNLVGFQTKLKYAEQVRVFRLIPALREACFLRLGSFHRNTYLRAPEVLNPDLSLRGYPCVYVAGQMTGVEGYLESAAMGLLAGIFVDQKIRGLPHSAPPAHTALGALLRHLFQNTKCYSPSGIHFGLFEQVFFENLGSLKRKELRSEMARQASCNFVSYLQKH
jgi:methylenetetrahydrofolate--tRNA-(uracil-5-)-methyltransferase